MDEYSVKATRTLYIGNLQSEISYNELRETYSAYGDIIVRRRCLNTARKRKEHTETHTHTTIFS
jgi:RNA recognition motif-containing protein